MTESQFSALRDYAECPDQCIDNGYPPARSLVARGWIREIVRGCWQITPAGQQAFAAVVDGTATLTADRDDAA